MQALRIDANPLRVRFVSDAPEPQPASGETLLHVRCAGICSTDLELARGYMGFAGIPGHEFVATVNDSSRRVVAEINVPPSDFQGDLTARKHAPGRTVLGILGRDGAMAERLTLPEACLLDVPDDLSDEQAVFAEPVAAALQILDDCTLEGAARVGVIGAGRLGLLCAQVLADACGHCDALLRSTRRLALVETLGLQPVMLEDIGDERPYDLLVDCTGAPQGLAWSLAHVRPRGQIVLKSTYATPQPLDLAPIVIDEIRVLGSRCGPMDAALRALRDGRLQTQPLIEARYALREAERAFEHAAQPGALKVLLQMEDAAC